jgi:hypothetical protein
MNHIKRFWSEEFQANLFGIRGYAHDGVEEDLATPPQTDRHIRPRPNYRSYAIVHSDQPWYHFAFYQEADEKRFIEKWAHLFYDDSDSPPKNWHRPKNPTGVQWCDRCRVFHEVRDPNLPPIEEEISELLAAEIAKAIDEEILQELLGLMKKVQ